ncbi:hypothetical protein CXB77_13085 [Chromatium okenii]|uniref:Ice-binding protein C-terminal domain-containing protein n=2 Tax=Chromatium okenii TaxID=61644 RepID=A0A2S7XNA3_9GAMM|nr:hypothetical protein CXB77_13085 [Chromatium okenii]
MLLFIATPIVFASPIVFINEIHYDNISTDTGEAIELFGTAGTDLTGWSLVLYNGADSELYDINSTKLLLGTFGNQNNSGFGTLVFNYPQDGIQNGAPDGIALVNNLNTVVQFLSYEGSFTAVGGSANGLPSTNIDVSESNATPVGHSLQLTGTGNQYSDFIWASSGASTFGSFNTGQTVVAANTTNTPDNAIPEPTALTLLGIGFAGLGAARRRQAA